MGSLAPGEGGGKAKSLDTLIRHGLPVPPGVVLDETDAPLTPSPGLYAVRSSSEQEDGSSLSQAGQFLSLIRISAQEVPEAIKQLRKHSKKQGTGQNFWVIVQEWIEPRVSGVAFSHHPTKDMPEVMLVDAVRGSNEGLMSGSVEGSRAFLWPDSSLVPDAYPLPKQALTELRDLVQRIATLFGQPVDVEWGWDGRKLWIFQARPITRFPSPSALDQEEARVMHLFAQKPDLRLERNDFAESTPRPDQATYRKIQALYQPGGAFQQAADALGLTYSHENAKTYLQLIFGWLYANPERQPIQPAKHFLGGFRSVLRLSHELTAFAEKFYTNQLANEPADKIYASASLLAQFSKTQRRRPVPEDLWQKRMKSPLKKSDWQKPKTMQELYAILREDSKYLRYSESTTVAVPMPVIITKQEALDLFRADDAGLEPSKNKLRGEGVSYGKVEALAQVCLAPKKIVSECIIVIPTLTSDWFPQLNQQVRGIITETGSSMSHGAIQCRERGIAAVFGVRGATRILKPGQKISLDGQRGVIEIL
jgi:phosphoenolpyruvate synthase/pyruvate phosphate dikinase